MWYTISSIGDGMKKQKTKIQIENKKILKRTWKEFALKFITSILMRGILMIIPVWYSDAIDWATVGNFEKAYHLIILSLLVYLAYYVIESINNLVFWKLYNRLYKRYTRLATYSTFQNSIYSLSRFSLGEYGNILNNDIDVICAFYANGVMRIVQILEFLIIYSYFFTLNIYIFFITVIVSILMIVVYVLSSKKTQKFNLERKATLDQKTSTLHEVFLGIKEIKGFHVFKNINERVKENSLTYLGANTRYDRFNLNVKVVVLSIIQSARYGLVLYGLYLISRGQMTVGSVMLIYTYYQKIIDNFDVINTISIELQNLKVSFTRFNKILEYSQEANDLVTINTHIFNGKIQFLDVLYGNKNDPILNTVSFEIPENRITVITGKAGSGKTGVFDLLLKLNQKHSGEIRIDDMPIEQIDGKTYYNLIASARKTPNFFDISIKDNLMLVEQNFDKIIEICKLLQIHDYISSLSHGYDTPIFSKEENISNNVKQLLAIARVLLKDSKIMLFDESLSVLEKHSSEIVLNLLNKLKENHTIIIISREKDIMKYADHIIVMHDNKIVETGTCQKLIKNKGTYYELYGA